MGSDKMNDREISNIDKRAAYMRHQAEEDNDTKVKSSALNSVKIFNNLSGDNTTGPNVNGPNISGSGARTAFDVEVEPVFITHITTTKDVAGAFDKAKAKMLKEFKDSLRTNE